jgi:hypothetical protein
MKKTLLDETVELLKEDKGDWRNTAVATGLGYDWLSSLSQGRIQDPGVKKIETLHRYLKEKLSNSAA